MEKSAIKYCWFQVLDKWSFIAHPQALIQKLGKNKVAQNVKIYHKFLRILLRPKLKEILLNSEEWKPTASSST